MSEYEFNQDILDVSLRQLLPGISSKKPLITGGCAVLLSANIGLSLIVMAFELSRSKIREVIKRQFLKDQIAELRRLQGELSKAALEDLHTFNEIRNQRGKISQKMKDPEYYALFINTIRSPLLASDLLVKIATTAQQTRFCKKAFISDLLSGMLTIQSSFKSLMLLAESNIQHLRDKDKEYFNTIKAEKERQGVQNLEETLFIIKTAS